MTSAPPPQRLELHCDITLENGGDRGFNLNLDIKEELSGVTGLFGPSGSGKTTLLRILCGLQPNLSAQVSFAGELWQTEKNLIVPAHKRGIGIVFQDARLFPHMTVEKNLKYAARRAYRSIHIDEIIKRLGIGNLLKQNPESLSAGQKQRVAIARALCQGPKVLLMDEPLAALDIKAKKEILNYLEETFKTMEVPVIYISHALNEVEWLCKNLWVMREGHILAQGNPAELGIRFDLPPAHTEDAFAILKATYKHRDNFYLLSSLSLGDETLWVKALNEMVGSEVLLRVSARDVSLSLSKIESSSILNSLSAVVKEIFEEDDATILIKLETAGQSFISRITRKSVVELRLEIGSQVFAHVKALSVVSNPF